MKTSLLYINNIESGDIFKSVHGLPSSYEQVEFKSDDFIFYTDEAFNSYVRDRILYDTCEVSTNLAWYYSPTYYYLESVQKSAALFWFDLECASNIAISIYAPFNCKIYFKYVNPRSYEFAALGQSIIEADVVDEANVSKNSKYTWNDFNLQDAEDNYVLMEVVNVDDRPEDFVDFKFKFVKNHHAFNDINSNNKISLLDENEDEIELKYVSKNSNDVTTFIDEIAFYIPSDATIIAEKSYPIIINDNEENVNLDSTILDSTIPNLCKYGMIRCNDEIEFSHDTNYSNVKFYNDKIMYNFNMMKDVLFANICDQNIFFSNIYFDGTVIYEDVEMFNDSQAARNLKIYKNYDVSKIYYEIWYDVDVKLDSNHKISLFDDGYNLRVGKDIMIALQDTDDLNILLFDKDVDDNNNLFNIANYNISYKKHFDLIDASKFDTSTILDSTIIIENWTDFDEDMTNIESFVGLGNDGYFNLDGTSLFVLVNYEVDDTATFFNEKTKFLKLNYDTTTYTLVDEMSLTSKISNLNNSFGDAVYYGSDKWFMEFENDNTSRSVLYVDLANKKSQFQANVNSLNENNVNFNFYLTKNRDDYFINALSSYKIKSSIENYYNYNIYRYSDLVNKLNSKKRYNESGENLQIIDTMEFSDDNLNIKIKLNEEVCLNCKDNYEVVDLDDDWCFINQNGTINIFDKNKESLYFQGNIFDGLDSVHSDNIIFDNNIKYDGTVAEILEYKNDILTTTDANVYNIKNLIDEFNILNLQKDTFFVLEKKDVDSTSLVGFPNTVIIRNYNGTTTLPQTINNMSNIDFIDEHYKLIRVVTKDKENDFIIYINLTNYLG